MAVAAQDGAVAAEFALVLPFLLLLLFGALQTALLVFSMASLAWATQATARCLAVSPLACPDPGAFGQAHYRGFGAPPVFVATTDTPCGIRVAATGRFGLLPGAPMLDAPIAAQACYSP